MNYRLLLTLICLLALSAAGSTARAVTVTSNQGTGTDGFAYSFAAVPFPLSTSYQIIPVGKTTTGHDAESLIRFDLSRVGLTSAQVTSAKLELYVGNSIETGFGQNPSALSPVQVNVFPLTGSWNRNSLVWANKPGTGTQIGSFAVEGINQWVSVDVTDLVKSWLDTPANNFGLLLRGNAPVGSSPNWTYAAFHSAFGPLGNGPQLTIVPEPSSWLLALAVAPVVLLARHKRARCIRAQ